MRRRTVNGHSCVRREDTAQYVWVVGHCNSENRLGATPNRFSRDRAPAKLRKRPIESRGRESGITHVDTVCPTGGLPTSRVSTCHIRISTCSLVRIRRTSLLLYNKGRPRCRSAEYRPSTPVQGALDAARWPTHTPPHMPRAALVLQSAPLRASNNPPLAPCKTHAKSNLLARVRLRAPSSPSPSRTLDSHPAPASSLSHFTPPSPAPSTPNQFTPPPHYPLTPPPHPHFPVHLPTMLAFAPSAFLPASRPRTRHASRARARPRHRPHPPSVTLTRASAPSLPPPVSDLSHLKRRSLLAFRGLSDLSSAAVLHELSMRLFLFPSLASAGAADSQLLLGGLMGVWTAAAFAARLTDEKHSLIRESVALPARWDAAYVYRPAIEPDDALAAIAWLHAFDEMEGPHAAALLRSLADADAPQLRLELANALARFPTRSNVAAAVLSSLAADQDPHVRDAAAHALDQYHATGVLVAAGDPAPEHTPREVDLPSFLDSLFDDDLTDAHMPPAPAAARTSWVMDAVAERVEALGNAALSSPDLRQLGAHAINVESAQVEEPTPPPKIQVPLFEGLRWEEVHGLCTLALVPAAYELMSVLDGGDLPLRFVGLGWLLSFGGLVAYPQSGNLWMRFKKTLDKMP